MKKIVMTAVLFVLFAAPVFATENYPPQIVDGNGHVYERQVWDGTAWLVDTMPTASVSITDTIGVNAVIVGGTIDTVAGGNINQITFTATGFNAIGLDTPSQVVLDLGFVYTQVYVTCDTDCVIGLQPFESGGGVLKRREGQLLQSGTPWVSPRYSIRYIYVEVASDTGDNTSWVRGLGFR